MSKTLKKSKSSKNILVFHVGVGQLPPKKAEAFIAKHRKNLMKQIPDDCLTIWLPHRAEGNSVQLIKLK